jgi:type IV pilus assembly protein PilC
MPLFKYQARNNLDKVISGTLEVENEAAATSALRQKRLEIISLSSMSGLEVFWVNINKKQPKVATKDVVIFSRQFSTMINSGLPILQGLTIVAEQAENKDFRELMAKVRDDISNGVPLSEALSRHPKVFSTLYVNMVKAGEQGGILDIIFERLSEYMEKAEGVTRKVKSAMMYPMVVMSIALLVVIFLLIKVIPTFAEVFKSFGAELPLPTRVILAVSNFLTSPQALILVAFIVGVFIAFNVWRQTKSGAFTVDKIILNMPAFGILARKAAVAKFARTFGTLIKSGVPIMDALETVAKTSGNLVVEKALTDARESLRSGKTLTQPLKESGIFPPMVTQMINVGEETGALDAMLTKVADFYEEEVDTAVEGITSIIEPILIVFLGVTLGFIVVAMFMPMFELGDLAG